MHNDIISFQETAENECQANLTSFENCFLQL